MLYEEKEEESLCVPVVRSHCFIVRSLPAERSSSLGFVDWGKRWIVLTSPWCAEIFPSTESKYKKKSITSLWTKFQNNNIFIRRKHSISYNLMTPSELALIRKERLSIHSFNFETKAKIKNYTISFWLLSWRAVTSPFWGSDERYWPVLRSRIITSLLIPITNWVSSNCRHLTAPFIL